MTTDQTNQIDELDAGMVPIGEQRRAVHTYDTEMNVQTLGTVVTRNYRGESAQRHYFQSAEGKNYRLGVTTTQFKFVDHTAALDPLVNRGYTIKDTVISRGGMHMYAVLERPGGPIVHDPMQWDYQYWHGNGEQGLRQVPRELHESIVVFSGIRPGKAITYRRGWFRLICSNGLVAEILGLGSVGMNHNNWNAENVTKKLNILPELSETIEMGPLAGSRRGVSRLAALLDQFVELPDTEADAMDPEDGTVGASVEAAVRDLPLFIRDEVVTFLSMPAWFQRSLSTQFKALAEVDREKVFVLDVVNAVTNPINLERANAESTRSVLRPLTRSNALTSAATKLIGAFSL